METKHTKLPDPIADTISEVSDELGKNDSMLIREYVEEGLERDGYLEHLTDQVQDSLREKEGAE